MRRPILFVSLCLLLGAALSAEAAGGRVLKVLPHFLDLKGRHSLSPSLYERDAYQAQLREHPEQRSGIRFDIRWKTRGSIDQPLKLRVEMRGTANGDLPSTAVLERELSRGSGFLSDWDSVPILGEEYRNFGELSAWRVTLWEGDQLLDEQKSFLW